MELIRTSCIFVAVLVVGVRTQYDVIVQSPFQVINNNNQLANGSCCLSTENTPQCSICPNTRLTLCFREDRHRTDDRNASNYSISSFSVSPEGIMGNGLQISFGSNNPYLGAFQLLFVVYRDVVGEPLIDTGLVRIELNLTDREAGDFRQIQRTGENGVATVILNLTVSCSESQPNCTAVTTCLPRDDLFGHYRCAVNGDLICLPGFQNPATDCTEATETEREQGPSFSAGVGIGIAVGVAVTFVLVTIGYIILWFTCRKRHTGAHTGPGGDNRGVITTTPNVVYGIRENEVSQEQSEEYHYVVVQ